MCGIIGYVGPRNGTEVVIEGLKRLEYRGYDSWGIAIKCNPSLSVHKQVGRISDFDDLASLPSSSIAVGHTRWATNGSVTKENAHPHTCCRGKVAVVHNGIIENFQELKAGLRSHRFVSETDTEIIAHLIEDNLSAGMRFGDAVKNALTRLDGRFAVVAVSADSKEVVAARKGSPLVVGLGKDEYFIASDIPAFLEHTRNVVFLDDGDVATISDGISFSDFEGGVVQRSPVEITWDVEQASLDGHEHYMIKEILEQRSTVGLAVAQEDARMMKVAKMINEANGTFFIGCGTAGKVGMVGSYIFSVVAKKHVNAVVGSEFPSYHDFLTPKTLLVCISQSGETADTLEAIEVAKRKGCKVVSVVNVMGSTMLRMSDEYILCNSGPEKAVCSTKVTTAQIALLTLLAYACAGRLEEGKVLLDSVSRKLDVMLDGQYLDEIRFLAKKIAGHESMYIIGRGLNYPMALEGSIKMQEVPYIHAEGFAGGELKHGPIALIENGTPCIALVAHDDVKHEILINALEIKSRGGFIIGISPQDNDIFDFWIPVPDIPIASPILNIIPIQLLSYFTALEKNCDPDKPRNLAKSVTVK
ncbi:glutamine--fructose-6-phosphate transaminase (isomerizing) [Candidatus Woesearchaeota archaeon]|nr:glutamine--fructose-6-phosphate transaminase (isomerizing) [Candidatus Woesearchaeota archaeon]